MRLAHLPEVPLETEIRGEYTIHKYVKTGRYDHRTFSIRMGGIIYDSDVVMQPSTSYNIVVDVPIGKLSIPISREGLENTSQNDEVIKDIRTHLMDIFEEDRKSIIIPKFGELRSGKVSKNNRHIGNWFVFDFNSSFPATQKFFYQVGLEEVPYGELVAPNGNGTYMVYVFPNIKNINNWKKRLSSALKKISSTYTGYMWCTHKTWDDMISAGTASLDISDCVFADIKTLKLPKLESDSKTQTAFQVIKCYVAKQSKTPQELDDYVTNKYFNDVETDDGWWKDAKTVDEIDYRTIGLIRDTSSRHGFWRANSQKMVDFMVELGWFTPDNPERLSRIEEICEENRLNVLKENAERLAESEFYNVGCNKRVLEAIKNKPERVNRIKQLKKNILSESSPRSRILNSISSWYPAINRNDLRKILRIK